MKNERKKTKKKTPYARGFSICRRRKWANIHFCKKTHKKKNISHMPFCHIVVGCWCFSSWSHCCRFCGCLWSISRFSLIFRVCVCRFPFRILFWDSSRKMFLPIQGNVYDAEDKGHFRHTTPHMWIKYTRPMIYRICTLKRSAIFFPLFFFTSTISTDDGRAISISFFLCFPFCAFSFRCLWFRFTKNSMAFVKI